MTASTAETHRVPTLADYPNLTPEEMGRRFLKLIDSLKTIDDLTPSTLDRVMKIRFLPPPSQDWGGGAWFNMHLPDSGWFYSISFFESVHRPENKSVFFQFSNPSATQNAEGRHGDMGPVCGMDFDAYTAELLRMGFVNREDMATYDTFPARALHPDPKTGEPVMDGPRSFRRPSWYFTRPHLLVRVDARAEAAQPDAKRNHACVERISVRRYDQ